MPQNSSERLAQLFERDLRSFEADRPADLRAKPRKPRVSRELDQQVVEFAAEQRTSGDTPEQMLKQLKAILAQAAPEVPGSWRTALVARLTGRAIDAFFEIEGKRGGQKE